MKGCQTLQARGVRERRQFPVENTQIKRGFFNRILQRVMQITFLHRLKTGVEVYLSGGLQNCERLQARRVRLA